MPSCIINLKCFDKIYLPKIIPPLGYVVMILQTFYTDNVAFTSFSSIVCCRNGFVRAENSPIKQYPCSNKPNILYVSFLYSCWLVYTSVIWGKGVMLFVSLWESQLTPNMCLLYSNCSTFAGGRKKAWKFFPAALSSNHKIKTPLNLSPFGCNWQAGSRKVQILFALPCSFRKVYLAKPSP